MRKEVKNLKGLSAVFSKADPFFLQLTFALAALGLLFAFTSSSNESYRISNNFLTLGLKQLAAFIIGFFFLIAFWLLDYKKWFKFAVPLSVLSLVLMMLTVFTGLGKTIGGSQRWIDIGFIQFQPAELAKICVIILTAKHLSLYKWFEKKTFQYIGLNIVIMAIILKQPDLGTTLLLLLIIAQLFFIYEWPVWQLLLIGFAGGYGCYLKIMSTPYQLDRLKFWLNPNLEPLGRGYNLIQAKYALGFGGITGVGIGNSIQKQGYLPVPHSDFIFAIMAEEIGFIGVTVVLLLFVTWLLRGLHLIKNIDDRFGQILATGIILLICTQSFLNIAVAIGLFPITGVTLPFFSCGGTSLIVTLAICGILFSIISRTNKRSVSI